MQFWEGSFFIQLSNSNSNAVFSSSSSIKLRQSESRFQLEQHLNAVSFFPVNFSCCIFASRLGDEKAEKLTCKTKFELCCYGDNIKFSLDRSQARTFDKTFRLTSKFVQGCRNVVKARGAAFAKGTFNTNVQSSIINILF